MLPRCLSRWCLLLCALHSLARSISIDNDIIGEPDIECLDDRIRVWVKTRKVFAGRIYAKGKAEAEECFKDDFSRERTKKPMFDLSFGGCGMKSLRSVDPRGMYYGITVVISFHPLFITKVDQAFHVKCFFEEANRGLTAELGVSMIPTTEVEARHGIPGCSYSIHRSSIEDLDAGRPAGQAIQFARVGDKVLHQWHCNDQMFGILINSCYVTDGFGKKAEVIDENGCPTDPILITGIRYSPDLQRAYAESQVFKFADKPGVWFFCQIQMCMKKAGMCKGITPPSCSSTAPPSSNGEDGGDGGDEESSQGSFGITDESGGFGGRRGGKGGFGGRGKGGRKNGRFGGNTDTNDYETPEKETNSDYDTPPRTQNKKNKKKGPTPAPDYSEDYDSNNLKLHSPETGPYGQLGATTPIDYHSGGEESTTVFGPPVSPDKLKGSLGATTIESVHVTESFETDNDLHSSEKTKTTKHDYNDYDDVTIPPNLTDLLANLPDDISADSLQKMFRDSVVDKKALLESFDMLKKEMMKENAHLLNPHSKRIGRSGDRINKIQVDWMSARHRDSPIPPELQRENATSKVRREAVKRNLTDLSIAPPMISGQLMIFEIDEEPPTESTVKGDTAATHTSSHDDTSIASDCAISRGGLMAVAGGLGTISAALFLVALYMFVRLNHLSNEKNSSISTSRQQLTLQHLYGKNMESGRKSGHHRSG